MSLYEMAEPLVAAPPSRPRRCSRLAAYNLTTQNRMFMYGISGMILLNVGFAAFMTDDDQNGVPDDPTFAAFYNVFEAVSTMLFTVEYMLRFWSCVETPGGVESFWPPWLVGECGKHPVNSFQQDSCAALWTLRLRWATNPTAIFDAVVCAAFWVDLLLEYWATEQMKGVGSTLRMFRIFQFAITILRLETQSPAFRRVAKVLTSSASELLLCLFLAGVLMVLGAVLIFFIEYQQVLGYGDNNQFDECGADEGLMRARFKSLSRCIYWSAMTITTVGYGDMHPCTPTGQMIAVIWGFFGVAVVALPSGIIGSGLVDVMAEAKEKKAADKKLAQLRATQSMPSPRGTPAPPSVQDMRDPTRFRDLGLAMLLPPGTVASGNPLSSTVSGSPRKRVSRAQSQANGDHPDVGREGLMKRLERAEEEGQARDSLRQTGRRTGAGAHSGLSSSRPGGNKGHIAVHLQDERGQLNLKSESVIRGCAALLFPGEFVFDPSAERAAERGVQLAEGLGATTAADIAGVQQVLVRKLAKEYLKMRFRESSAIEDSAAQELSLELDEELEQDRRCSGNGQLAESVVPQLTGVAATDGNSSTRLPVAEDESLPMAGPASTPFVGSD